MSTINGKRRFFWASAAAGMLVVGALCFPTPARAQFALGPILAVMKVVESIMTHVITPTMSAMSKTESHMASYQQTVMYPEKEIATFQHLAPVMLDKMTSMHNMMSTPVNSAALPAPHAFETNIMSANPNSVANVSSSYSSVYGPLPPSSEISPQIRTVVDMNDADAEDGDKLAIKLDAIANTEQMLSEQYMKQLGSTAPGNAALIAAQAGAMNLEAEAYTQQALDELLRLEAAGAAYQGFTVKSAATAHQNALTSTLAAAK